MKSNPEKGQAILLVLVAMGLFLFGALALALDISQWFAHQQMAQVAADAAAQAAMLSIFQGVNDATTNPTTYFPTSAPFPCSAYPNSTPCKYVAMNGFGNDTVTVSFPACIPSANAGCASFTPNEVQVNITRSVRNSFIRMIGGPAANSISATGIAACLTVDAPIPLLIIHPTMGGSLVGDSNTTIFIKGGPSKSIQVNSSDPQAVGLNNKFPLVNLTQAYLGTGADFGAFGGPSSEPGTFNLGTGQYVQPASPVPDPLCLSGVPATCNVAPPIRSALSAAPSPIVITPRNSVDPVYGCPTAATLGAQVKNCLVYSPGIYSATINPGQDMAIFQPGIYWMDNGVGFGSSSHGGLMTCSGTGCITDAVTQTGMLVYNSGGGYFSITGSSSVTLLGTPETSIYKGILFFQDRASPPTGSGASSQHQLGGGGTLELQGTIYITNTTSTILGSAGHTHFQQVNYHGGPCSNTFLLGMIIVDALSLAGGGCVNMTLETASYLKVEQVALVGGGPHF